MSLIVSNHVYDRRELRVNIVYQSLRASVTEFFLQKSPVFPFTFGPEGKERKQGTGREQEPTITIETAILRVNRAPWERAGLYGDEYEQP